MDTTTPFGAAEALEPHASPSAAPGIRVLDDLLPLRALTGRGVRVELAVNGPEELEVILSARVRGRDGRREARGRGLVLKSQSERAAAVRGRYQRLDRAVVRASEAGTVAVHLKPSPLQRLALRGEDALLAQLDVRRRGEGDRPVLRRRLRFR